MKITNKACLSKSVVDALTFDDYDLSLPPPNIFSCTTIIDAPRPYFLRTRHDSEITIDVLDNVWLLDGSAVHYAVEMSNKSKGSDRLSEERFYIEAPIYRGEWAVHQKMPGTKIEDQPWYSTDKYYCSVKFDHYDPEEKAIEDYKRTSPWEWVHGIKPSRERQLNIGAFALSLAGFPVEVCRVCFFFKDFDKRKAAEGGDYPATPIAQKNLSVWSNKEREDYILERMEIFIEASKKIDSNLPVCSEEDRWYIPGTVALMKNDNIKATKVFDEGDTDGMATYLEKAKMEYPKAIWQWEKRRGIDKRCEEYCRGHEFCTYFQNSVTCVGQSGY